MNPSEPTLPAPPPDDEFCRLIGDALNADDLSLTEGRRAAVLKAFAEVAQPGGGKRRRVIHTGWWLTAGAAVAACAALWFAGTFRASPEAVQDRPHAKTVTATPETTSAGVQLELANLRLAILTEQLSRAEHRLIWQRAREEKTSSN